MCVLDETQKLKKKHFFFVFSLMQKMSILSFIVWKKNITQLHTSADLGGRGADTSPSGILNPHQPKTPFWYYFLHPFSADQSYNFSDMGANCESTFQKCSGGNGGAQKIVSVNLKKVQPKFQKKEFENPPFSRKFWIRLWFHRMFDGKYGNELLIKF